MIVSSLLPIKSAVLFSRAAVWLTVAVSLEMTILEDMLRCYSCCILSIAFPFKRKTKISIKFRVCVSTCNPLGRGAVTPTRCGSASTSPQKPSHRWTTKICSVNLTPTLKMYEKNFACDLKTFTESYPSHLVAVLKSVILYSCVVVSM